MFKQFTSVCAIVLWTSYGYGSPVREDSIEEILSQAVQSAANGHMAHMGNEVSIGNLPDELLQWIASYLSPQELLNFANTAKRYKQVFNDRPFINKVWQKNYPAFMRLQNLVGSFFSESASFDSIVTLQGLVRLRADLVNENQLSTVFSMAGDGLADSSEDAFKKNVVLALNASRFNININDQKTRDMVTNFIPLSLEQMKAVAAYASSLSFETMIPYNQARVLQTFAPLSSSKIVAICRQARVFFGDEGVDARLQIITAIAPMSTEQIDAIAQLLPHLLSPHMSGLDRTVILKSLEGLSVERIAALPQLLENASHVLTTALETDERAEMIALLSPLAEETIVAIDRYAVNFLPVNMPKYDRRYFLKTLALLSANQIDAIGRNALHFLKPEWSVRTQTGILSTLSALSAEQIAAMKMTVQDQWIDLYGGIESYKQIVDAFANLSASQISAICSHEKILFDCSREGCVTVIRALAGLSSEGIAQFANALQPNSVMRYRQNMDGREWAKMIASLAPYSSDYISTFFQTLSEYEGNFFSAKGMCYGEVFDTLPNMFKTKMIMALEGLSPETIAAIGRQAAHFFPVDHHDGWKVNNRADIIAVLAPLSVDQINFLGERAKVDFAGRTMAVWERVNILKDYINQF